MSEEFDFTKPLEFKTVDEAIEVYVDMRNELRVHMKTAKEKEENLKGFLDRISMWLRDKGDELGIDSFKTKHGTAYRNVKKKFQMSCWEKFIDWIIETKNTQCLEKRVAQRATKEVFEHNIEINKERAELGEEPILEVPPGLDMIIEVEFNVLSPKKSPGEEED